MSSTTSKTVLNSCICLRSHRLYRSTTSTDSDGNATKARDTSAGGYSKEYLQDTSITGGAAKSLALSEIQKRTVTAAQTNDAVASAMNSLLIGAMEISDSATATPVETLEVKKEASKMLELASSLEALTTSLDPSDTANKAFYDRAKQQQDQLKADYVGLTLSEWQATDQLSNKDEVQADYMNAASVGVTIQNGRHLQMHSKLTSSPILILRVLAVRMKPLFCSMLLNLQDDFNGWLYHQSCRYIYLFRNQS